MKIIQQDMTLLTEGVLFHQVNCQGVMGAGIAAAFAVKWPLLEAHYREFCESNADDLLGKLQLVNITPTLWVANVFGQESVSRGSRQTSYDATVVAFERVERHMKTNPPSTFNKNNLYFPFKMGCGLGGGDWKIYSAIIERYFPDAIICQHEPAAR